MFSNELFGEVTNETQQKSYADVKKLQKKIEQKIDREPHNEFMCLREYYK